MIRDDRPGRTRASGRLLQRRMDRDGIRLLHRHQGDQLQGRGTQRLSHGWQLSPPQTDDHQQFRLSNLHGMVRDPDPVSPLFQGTAQAVQPQP